MGLRLVLVVVVLTIGASTSNAVHGQEGGRPVPKQPKADQTKPQDKPPAAPIGELPSASKDAARCEDTEANNGPDICAQWAAANAARKSAEIAQLSLTWGIASFAALFLTLLASAWAALAAVRASNAAVQSNKINQQAINVDQRAWLKVEPVIRGRLDINQYGGLGVSFGVKITNIGKSPAHKIRTHIEMICGQDITQTQKTLDEIAAAQASDDHQWTRSLLPGQSYIREWYASRSETDRVLDGKNIVMPYIFACVTYKTIFVDGPHQTAFVVVLGEKTQHEGFSPITYKQRIIERQHVTIDPSEAIIIT